MCIIIDANKATSVFTSDPDPDHKPIRDWLDKSGKFIIGGKLTSELNIVKEARGYLKEKWRTGQLISFPDEDVEKESAKIADLCVSNDAHIVALARISGARLLCSGDEPLHKDFTNPQLLTNPNGHIYQNKTHVHLLNQYGHTKACGRSK